MGKGKPRDPYDSYEDVVSDLYGLKKFTGRMSLDPITEVMGRLGDPHRVFPAIHVAGTNGKGSTTQMTAEMLTAAGYTVGTYTSPHLTDFRERIRIDGEPIPTDAVIEYYRDIMEHTEDIDITFFECTTALAFMHFAREAVDIAVVETGIGGRLDATNILEPDLAVITNVAEDHTHCLGETPEQIAYEKAGIITEETPVVSGADGSPGNVVQAVADQKQADMIAPEDAVSAFAQDIDGLQVSVEEETVRSPVRGRYQVDNMNLAVTACRSLDGFDVMTDHIVDGLSTVRLEGRMECVAEHPLVLFEGAHNPAGMQAAAETIQELQTGKTITVVSIMGDKDYEKMMAEIESFSDLIILSRASIGRAADPEDLAECIDATDHEIEPSIRRSLEKTLQMADEDDTIVFTGSLYFVGDVKQMLNEMWC